MRLLETRTDRPQAPRLLAVGVLSLAVMIISFGEVDSLPTGLDAPIVATREVVTCLVKRDTTFGSLTWDRDGVADEVIMINGLPGAGKTTVGASLANEMPARFLSKDVLKEHLAQEQKGLPSSSLGVIASELMWSQASAQSGVVIVESWWYRMRDAQFAADGLFRSGADRAVEVWCTAPVDVVRERYRSRSRSALHCDQERLATDWENWARNAEPLNLTPVIMLSTAAPVDAPGLLAAVRAVLPTSSVLRSRVARDGM